MESHPIAKFDCFYLETPGGQNSYLYLNVVLFFKASVNYTSVAVEDSCFTA